MQSEKRALLHGGCNICSGTTLSEDPSGSDSTDLWFLDTSRLTRDAFAAGDLHAAWSRAPSRGFATMPPRKNHDAVAVGCDGAAGGCSVLAYGGWNPRWLGALNGLEGIQRLDTASLSWSVIPADGVMVRRLEEALTIPGVCLHVSDPQGAACCCRAAALLCEPDATTLAEMYHTSHGCVMWRAGG